MLIGGTFNHLRHVLTYGIPGNKTHLENLADASFTALPMCTAALFLIGHLAHLQNRLYLQATRDPLTALPNRRWFMDNTPETMGPSEHVMIIDVDYFKSINDRFGHDVGDRCLFEGAAHLMEEVGSDNKLARIGGEEFAVYFPHADGCEVSDIARAISAGFDFDTGPDAAERITFSVGIASFAQTEPRKEALKRADIALYRAKSAGRSCFEFDTNRRPSEAGQLLSFTA